jgi:hypothetical protein
MRLSARSIKRGDTYVLAERTAQATDLDVNYAKNGAASMRAA